MAPNRMPSHGHDPATDRAAALLRELDSLKTDEPMLAKPLERLAARLFDMTALAMATILIVTAFSLVRLVVSGSPSENEQPDPFRTPTTRESGATAAVTVAILLAYEVVTNPRRGQTLGKGLMGLRVLTAQGRATPGWRRAALRCFVWAVPFSIAAAFWSVPIMYGATISTAVIWLWALWGKDHRGLHDIVAGTVVIRPRR